LSSLSQYKALAERRFRQYKWEKRKAVLEKAFIAAALRLFENTVPVLQNTGVVKRRAVERIDVE
jgi:hypothetical protein